VRLHPRPTGTPVSPPVGPLVGLAMSLVLAVSLVSCAVDADEPTTPSSTPSPSTAAGEPERRRLDASYDVVRPRLDERVVERFGRQLALRGVDQVVDLLVTHQLRDDLLTAGRTTAPVRRALRDVGRWMSQDAQQRWRADTGAYLRTDLAADPTGVWDLVVVGYDQLPEGTRWVRGAVVDDPRMVRVTAAHNRAPATMRVRVETRADLRLRRDGPTREVLRLPVLKTTTVVLKRLRTRWVVAEYRGSFVPTAPPGPEQSG